MISKSVDIVSYKNDDQFLFMTTRIVKLDQKGTGHSIKHGEIWIVDTHFSNYSQTMVYIDKNNKAELLNFSVDNVKNRLIVLSGIKNQKNKRDKFITIYDLDSEKTVYQLQVKSREIIGRLKSNLYSFVDGHIYYGNNVIKVRYDLLSNNRTNLRENQLFDHYSDIMEVYHDDYIQSGTPLQCSLYNRLAYLIKNKRFKVRKLLILPYLHERRIILNRRFQAN